MRRYGQTTSDDEPERLHAEGLAQTRTGPVGLLRDLQDLYLLVSFVEMTWTVVGRRRRRCGTASCSTSIRALRRGDNHPSAMVPHSREAGRPAGAGGLPPEPAAAS